MYLNHLRAKLFNLNCHPQFEISRQIAQEYDKFFPHTDAQSQKAVSAYFTSRQILPLGTQPVSLFFLLRSVLISSPNIAKSYILKDFSFDAFYQNKL